MNVKKWFGLFFLWGFTVCAQAKPVQVAVAANFSKPMQSLVTEFEKDYDYQIALSFGSSGKFMHKLSRVRLMNCFSLLIRLSQMLWKKMG